MGGNETATPPLLSVIIPARNEAGYIGACLAALCAQDLGAGPIEVIVAANGCSDDTAGAARACTEAFAARGWTLDVLDLPEGGKPGALNAADTVARGPWRLYLDADIVCSPGLVAALRAALDRPEPAYATGRLRLAPAASQITQHYGDFWTRLPFVRGGAVGAGLYAVNAPGRARWTTYPAIISDDSFVRLQFAPAERHEVPADYVWPLAEGFRALVRVRRRQDYGMRELFALHPELARHEGKARLGPADLMQLAFAAPIGFLVYTAIALAVRARHAGGEFSRGR